MILVNPESKEQRKYRLTALLERIRLLLNQPQDASLARLTGLSPSAVQRIKDRRSASLEGANLDRICNFLVVEPTEFESYLEGSIPLETITRNLVGATSQAESISKETLRQMRDDLPKLLLEDLYQLFREVTGRFLSLSRNYKLVESSIEESSGKLISEQETLSQILKRTNLDDLAERSGINRRRLGVLADGAEPNAQELSMLACCLDIPLSELEEICRRTSNGSRGEMTNGTT